MSPPFPERPIDRDRALMQRGRQNFAGVCGQLHFFAAANSQAIRFGLEKRKENAARAGPHSPDVQNREADE